MSASVKELFIDVSDYEAPKPFEEVIQLLRQMTAGEYVRMQHRKKPLPLLEMLQENGFDFIVRQNSTFWEIIIWFAKDQAVGDYCHGKFQ